MLFGVDALHPNDNTESINVERKFHSRIFYLSALAMQTYIKEIGFQDYLLDVELS